MNTNLEREEGKDYSQGYKTYGFAAPFTTIDQGKMAAPTLVAN
jgi:hypothetical protein